MLLAPKSCMLEILSPRNAQQRHGHINVNLTETILLSRATPITIIMTIMMIKYVFFALALYMITEEAHDGGDDKYNNDANFCTSLNFRFRIWIRRTAGLGSAGSVHLNNSIFLS